MNTNVSILETVSRDIYNRATLSKHMHVTTLVQRSVECREHENSETIMHGSVMSKIAKKAKLEILSRRRTRGAAQ